MLEGVWRKGNRLHCWWEYKLVQPLWRIVWRYLRKLYIEPPYDSAIPLLGIHLDKTFSQKVSRTPMFIAALFIIAKIWKQRKCPSTYEWIKKMWYMYKMNYYSAIKKNKIMSFAAIWIQLEILILSEVGKKEKEVLYDITYIWNIKYGTHEPIYRMETDSWTWRIDL